MNTKKLFDSSVIENMSSLKNSNKYGTCNSSLLDLLRNTEIIPDPFHGLKQDPAVLEAIVTTDKNPEENDSAKDISVEVAVEGDLVEPTESNGIYEDIVSSIESSLKSLTEEQLVVLFTYARVLRAQRENIKPQKCAFCKKNGKPLSWYTGHVLRDDNGRVRCPVLRALRCPCCLATGDDAHTIKYCPNNS